MKNSYGKFLREKREALEYSQYEVGTELGYKNAQFISNIERDLAMVPLEKLPQLCQLLKISKKEIKDLKLRLYGEKIDHAFVVHRAQKKSLS